mgnify:CR=1 FL=1
MGRLKEVLSLKSQFNLQRFIDAQNLVYDQVISELKQGRKTTHWIWFIFPQMQGLGKSEMSREFAIVSYDEARAYLDDLILGSRLLECTDLVLKIQNRSLDEIFGWPDSMKFCSSMKLFNHVSFNTIFKQALDKYCI